MFKLKKLFNKITSRRINFKSIGDNVVIERKVTFYSPENIIIGNDVYIGFEGLFMGYGGIEISDGTILGHRVEIMTRNHNYNSIDLQSIPYDSRYINKKVTIEKNVWIGSNVKIVPGVTIGEGSVVGMGAIVTKSFPPYSIIGGNPAKLIKQRNIEVYNELKNENKIYLKLKNSKLVK